MADIVLGIGTSHSPLLNSPAEDYPKHAAIDAAGRKLLDKNGRPCTYGELLEKADPSIKAQIEPQVLEQRSAQCTANIEKLSRELIDAKLDALVIIGDDQHEQFFDDNMPAILVYWGETIANNPLHMDEDAPAFWRKARSQYHVEAQSRDYPVDSKLALHLIEAHDPEKGLAENEEAPSVADDLQRARHRAWPAAQEFRRIHRPARALPGLERRTTGARSVPVPNPAGGNLTLAMRTGDIGMAFLAAGCVD